MDVHLVECSGENWGFGDSQSLKLNSDEQIQPIGPSQLAGDTNYVIPPGTYATTEVGDAGVIAPAATTSLLATFAGAQINGDWTVRVSDCYFSDSTSVTAVSLDIEGTTAVTPPASVTAVPTLSEWSLMLLGLLAAGLGMRRLRI